MAFNVRSGGKAESVPVPETVVSGDLVRVGELVGIAEIDAFLGGDGATHFTTVALEGIAHAPLAGAHIPGTALYTDDAGPGTVELATSGAKAVGYVTRGKETGATDVFFKLVPNVTADAA